MTETDGRFTQAHRETVEGFLGAVEEGDPEVVVETSCEEKFHSAIRALQASHDEGWERVKEDNRFCLCGCPVADHENYGEDGESCGDEDHVCLRVCAAVVTAFADLRAEVERLEALETRAKAVLASSDERLKRDAALEARIDAALALAKAIAEWKTRGEVFYDEFAYNRMEKSFREAGRQIVKALRPEPTEARVQTWTDPETGELLARPEPTEEKP